MGHGSQAQGPTATLAFGTPVLVRLDETLSTEFAEVGDSFSVTVIEDVVSDGTVVIPAGARGKGEVTFVSRKGGFGKGGFLSISLRTLDLGGRTHALDGRYREEGKSNGGATAATFFLVGIVAGVIKGEHGGIEAGRVLKAAIGEDLQFVIGAPPPPVPPLAPLPETAANSGTEEISPSGETPAAEDPVTESAHQAPDNS